MFTFEDIKNIAIQIEENGEKTYRQLSDHTEDEQIKKMFTWMADEEKHHANWFKQLQADTKLDKEQQELALMGKSLLQDMVKDKTFSLDRHRMEEADNLEEILLQSCEFEEDTVLFYEFLATLISDSEAIKQLDIIINEEKKHARELTELAKSLQIQIV